MRLLSSLLAFILLNLACGCSEYSCADAEIHYRLIGFTDNEAGTFTIRKITKGTNNVTDSIVVNASNPVGYNRFGDTLIMSTYSPYILLQSKYDYELVFPLASRTVRVTEIAEPRSSGKNRLFNNTKELCVNQVTGCRIDGQLLTSISFPNTIYLRK